MQVEYLKAFRLSNFPPSVSPWGYPGRFGKDNEQQRLSLAELGVPGRLDGDALDGLVGRPHDASASVSGSELPSSQAYRWLLRWLSLTML